MSLLWRSNIGKESNSLESVEDRTTHSEVNVYTECVDPKRTEWITAIQPTLKNAKLKVLEKACENWLSRRELIELRAGRSKPHPVRLRQPRELGQEDGNRAEQYLANRTISRCV
jgi:hypothetical protein